MSESARSDEEQPQTNKEILETLLRLLQDSNSRSTDADSVIRFAGWIMARSYQAEHVADALLGCSMEQDRHVTKFARQQLAVLIKRRPPQVESIVDDVLRHLHVWRLNQCGIEDDVLGACLMACPSRAEDITTALLVIRCDTWRLSVSCQKHCHQLKAALKACPEKAGEIIIALLEGCCNVDTNVGSEAWIQLRMLMDCSFGHTTELLALAICGTENVDFDVGDQLHEQLLKLTSRWHDTAVETMIRILRAGCRSGTEGTVWDLLADLLFGCPRGEQSVVDTLRCLGGHPDDEVRRDTLYHLQTLIEKFPKWSRDVLPPLLEGWNDCISAVIDRAPCVLPRLIELYPGRAEEVLATVLRRCNFRGECCASFQAMCVLPEIASMYPDNAEEIVETLLCKFNGHEKNTKIAAMACLAKLTGIYPHKAEAICETMLRCCNDENSDVRKTVMTISRELVCHCPDKIHSIIEILSQGCRDRTPIVREVALRSLADSIGACPIFATRAVSVFIEDCKRTNNWAMLVSMRCLGQIAKQYPHFLPDEADLFLHDCSSFDSYAEMYAMSQWAVVAMLCPERAEEIASLLFPTSDDEDVEVLDIAVPQLAEMIHMLPETTEKIVSVFLGWSSRDREFDVRLRVAGKFAELVTACHARKNEIVDTLIRMCSDEDPDVRIAAIKQVGKTAKACPAKAQTLVVALLHICSSYDRCTSEAARAELMESLTACPEIAIKILKVLLDKEATGAPQKRQS